MKQVLFHNLYKGVLAAVCVLLLASPFAATTVAATTLAATAVGDTTVSDTEGELPQATLSPHWNYKILRWESSIIEAAQTRKLDPDFLASLVWMESRGDPNAVGPVGAIGLMQVMPKEAGYTWRPSQDALMDPFTNLYWGSRTLATIIGQSKGDIFNALAAYNGGWNQVMYRGPTIFATNILRDYARAVALRYQVDGPWIAFFARKDIQIKGPIWIADSERSDVYFFGNDNIVPEGMPLIPDVTPSSVIAYSQEEKGGSAFLVGIWIYAVANGEWLSTQLPESTLYLVEMETNPQSPATSTPSAVKIPVVAAASPTLTPTESPMPAIACSGGDLTVDAWPLHTVINPQGWTVTIFAEGHGGDCHYTYSWNIEEEIQGVVVGGPITFEIHTPRRDSAIVGTVVVSSAGETVRVPLYVPSPKK